MDLLDEDDDVQAVPYHNWMSSTLPWNILKMTEGPVMAESSAASGLYVLVGAWCATRQLHWGH